MTLAHTLLPVDRLAAVKSREFGRLSEQRVSHVSQHESCGCVVYFCSILPTSLFDDRDNNAMITACECA